MFKNRRVNGVIESVVYKNVLQRTGGAVPRPFLYIHIFFFKIIKKKSSDLSTFSFLIEGKNHDINLGNRWFENVAQFRYLGTTLINQNPIYVEIKRRLNLLPLSL
jgi:hypothetical protein